MDVFIILGCSAFGIQYEMPEPASSAMRPAVTLLTIIGIAFFNWWRKERKKEAGANGIGKPLPGMPSLQNALPYLTFELTRARRYNHTLSLLVLGFDDNELKKLIKANSDYTEQWGNDRLARKFLFNLIGMLLRENLRDSDIISYDVLSDHFVALLTDTNEKQAALAVSRMNCLVSNQISAQLKAGIAEFPLNGLTIEDLLKYARTRFYHQSGQTLSQNGHLDAHRNGDLRSQPADRESQFTLSKK